MLSIMVFVPYINLDFETFNCYYIINSNYSEPLRTKKADASCSHVSSRFSCSQGGSGWIRKTRYRRDAHEESFGTE